MKFNWGHGIVVAFVLFCTFVVSIVVRAFQEDFDLVSETYYQDEIAYQDRIDSKANLKASGQELAINQNDSQVVMTFPEEFSAANGTVKFYYPSRALFDKEFPIKLVDNQQVIAKNELAKGRYKVQVSWKVGDDQFYQEKELFVK
ncbi:FixH family protein [Marinoscillum pacificum]|uniref:FixH family protein n=1 Tax=Marinoscillum pacificum TaxID=392723 RepID=UPI002158133D|nr:FixH family protein [Marinoscillum pacificum]